MFKTTGEALAFIDAFLPALPGIPPDVQIVICPPFTALPAVREALARSDSRQHSRIAVGAQNMHWDDRGPFTGEISAPMLVDLGVSHVILGHSERRRYFDETDETVRRKTAAALQHGLTPIVAVGESLEIRQAGNAGEHVVAQVRAALSELDAAVVTRVVVAYEPIWAIGTGENCDPAAADDIMGAIRQSHPGLRNAAILYGGSVKPENIAQYVAQPNIDGGLIGGASLQPADFAQLARQTSAA